MTDDDLDRALAGLPLPAAPAGLHARILAATVFRSPEPFRPWELWLLGTALAVTVWLASLLIGGAPGAAALIGAALHAAAAASPTTLLWLAVGAATAWWTSHLVLMPAPRRPVMTLVKK